MAVTVITPEVLTLATRSADLPDASGVVATTPADGWDIADISAYHATQILLKFLADASGDTVYITAGDNPPAVLAGLGSLAIVLAASDVRYVVVETARHMQDNGKIHAYCADAGTMCWAMILPRGA
jgi:hypothetical protein